MGSNAQVALEKFACYFEVQARILEVSENSNYRLDPELVKKNIDENTIGVFVNKPLLGILPSCSRQLFESQDMSANPYIRTFYSPKMPFKSRPHLHV